MSAAVPPAGGGKTSPAVSPPSAVGAACQTGDDLAMRAQQNADKHADLKQRHHHQTNRLEAIRHAKNKIATPQVQRPLEQNVERSLEQKLFHHDGEGVSDMQVSLGSGTAAAASHTAASHTAASPTAAATVAAPAVHVVAAAASPTAAALPKISELKKLARAGGASEVQLDEAGDATDHRAALNGLLLQQAEKAARQAEAEAEAAHNAANTCL